MTKKSLLLAGALALATISVASARSYDIALYKPSMAGNVHLKAGDYTLRVTGSNAVLTEYHPSLYMWATPVRYEKPVTIPVKVERVSQKFSQTAVVSTKKGDVQQINLIELGGTHIELEFR